MSGRIEIPTPDGVADAYLSGPDSDPRGGVLLAMDAFGLRPQIEEMADRIAAEDYAVLAPNVFYRAGRDPVGPVPDLEDPDARAAFFAQIRPLMEQLGPDAAASDGVAYLDRLEQEVQGPFAITGYCMGARFGLRIAAAHPDRVAALGGFHGGGLVTDAPDSPHRSVGSVRAEVYFGHADDDPSMTPDQIAVLDEAMAAAGVRHRADVYAGARHGYTMADTPAYDGAACERHFTALFELLERTLPRA